MTARTPRRLGHSASRCHEAAHQLCMAPARTATSAAAAVSVAFLHARVACNWAAMHGVRAHRPLQLALLAPLLAVISLNTAAAAGSSRAPPPPPTIYCNPKAVPAQLCPPTTPGGPGAHRGADRAYIIITFLFVCVFLCFFKMCTSADHDLAFLGLRSFLHSSFFLVLSSFFFSSARAQPGPKPVSSWRSSDPTPTLL